MAVPKRKTSTSRRNMRKKMNMKVTLPNVVVDKETGEYRLSHFATKTGMYNGKKVTSDKTVESDNAANN